MTYGAYMIKHTLQEIGTSRTFEYAKSIGIEIFSTPFDI